MLPLVMICIGLILWLIVYQYNRCLLEQDLGMLSVRASSFAVSEGEMLPEVEQLEAGINGEKYLSCVPEPVKAEALAAGLKISGGLSMRNPFLGWNWVGEDGCKIVTAYENRKLSPVFVIRSHRKLEQAIESDDTVE